ncbi:MAG TPA: VIT1/CCC1 transporter family protein [Actinomycetota bacterium]|nr:VIT1/CCC1 transporter family protein [Actinomycetota bacterium]
MATPQPAPPPDGSRATPDQIRRWTAYYEDELAGAALYRALAAAADSEARREVFSKLAGFEEKHAAHWESLLRLAGVEPLPPRVGMRVKVLGWVARTFGVESVLPVVLRAESADAAKYDAAADAAEGMAAEERGHGQTVAAIAQDRADRIAAREGRHRVGAGGALRAGVFGVNDGLVSNLSLVVGVAGGTGNAKIVLLAGVAGLLAGAFSMAAGEWISVRSQTELYEREVEVERGELEAFPEEEEEELALIFRAKGLSPDTAATVAREIMARPEVALETLTREELGFSPDDVASPWVASISSFLAFSLGAFVPVVPYLFATGAAAVWSSVIASGLSLFFVGSALAIFTGRRPMHSGLRMLAIGSAAAATTFGIGSAIGVSIT